MRQFGAASADRQTLKAKTGFRRSMPTDVTLCPVSEIPEGGMKSFEIMGFDILVVRHQGRFFCVDAACTYKYAMLTDGRVDAERLAIVCKDCNGAWDLATGQPKDSPAKFPLTAYEIRPEGDDLIVTFTY